MFSPREVDVFRFVGNDFDHDTGVALFHYSFDEEEFFTERYAFPGTSGPADGDRKAAIERALFLLSLAAGISYYKAAAPEIARIESDSVTAGELDFLEALFLHGLGEFAYVNKLSLTGRPRFEYEQRDESTLPALSLGRRALVAVGGGKDSCVSIETLRNGGEPMILASINAAKPIVDVIAEAQTESVLATRTLSPRLLELNDQGAYNGHVPITAVVSLALVVTALRVDCDTVIMSNERSASQGNLEYEGRQINHQYSKSLDAERVLSGLVQRSVAPNLSYVSLLRPLSELDIARRFAAETRYDDVFTSCNKAFRLVHTDDGARRVIDEPRRTDRWCCDCPKCRFVFLALAPFASPERLLGIFGCDLLDEPNQAGGFDELMGWHANKPFECVGEVEESIAAFIMLSESPQWKNHAIVRRFAGEIGPAMALPPDLLSRVFTMSSEHELLPRYLEMLHAPE